MVVLGLLREEERPVVPKAEEQAWRVFHEPLARGMEQPGAGHRK